jgi:hypothetical protein
MVTLIWGEGRQEAHRGGLAAATTSGRRGCADEVVGRLWLVRLESTSELGRRYG